MTAYATRDEFLLLSVCPAELLDALDAVAPGWTEAQLEAWSRQIDARLRKRYAVPFAAPYPQVAKAWLARIVTMRAYLRRGVDSTDQQFLEIKADHDRALDEIREAADSATGLYDLPLVEGSSSSGIARGGPRVYSETSPYAWTDGQVDTGRSEDRNRGGSYA